MTVQQMRTRVLDNFNREPFPTKTMPQPVAPSFDSVIGILNDAKDRVVRELESTDENVFVESKDVAVVKGGAVTLPGDTDAATGITLPAWRRLIAVTRTDGDNEIEFKLIDMRERHKWAKYAYCTYLRGNELVFANADGAHEAMTVTLVYRIPVPDVLDLGIGDPGDLSYTFIPAEWHAAIVRLASAMAMPSGSSGYQRYMGEFAIDLQDMQRSSNRLAANRPLRVQMSDDSPFSEPDEFYDLPLP